MTRQLPILSLFAAAMSLALGASCQTVYTPYTFVTLAGSAGNRGTNDGVGTGAQFNSPHGVAVDQLSCVYVADLTNHVVRKISPSGEVITLAGWAGHPGSSNGTGSDARFNQPWGVAVDGADNVYVTDAFNHTIRKITPDGTVSTIAGLAGVSGTNDGIGSAARFNIPHGIAVDAATNLYITDHQNYTIRKITPDGMVTTLAGLAGTPGSANGIGSQARFRYPSGIAVNSAGVLFVADEFNHAIRRISTSAAVSTFAGLAGTPGSADGTGGAARFHNPHGCAVDSVGNLFVSELVNNTVRRITTNAVVTTLAGVPGTAGSADGTGSLARFSVPRHTAVDSAGNVYLADFGNQTIRKGWPIDATPQFSLRTPMLTHEQMRLEFTVATGSAATYTLLQAAELAGPWTTNSLEVLITNVPGVSYSFDIPLEGEAKFYQVQTP